MKKLIRMLLSLSLLSLLLGACALDAGERRGPGVDPYGDVAEPESSALKQAQSSYCHLIIHTSIVNPLPPKTQYPGGWTDLIIKVKNTGTAACAYKISADYYNGPNYDGIIAYSIPTLQAPVLQPGVIKSHAWGQIPMVRPCFYKEWLKYRETPSSPDLWHEFEVQWC